MKDPRRLERLRQEREAFDQAKEQAAQWSLLRLRMGYTGIAILLGVALVCGYIVLNPAGYSSTITTLAATTMLVDIVSLAVSIFKLVLQQGNAARLKPVTIVRLERP